MSACVCVGLVAGANGTCLNSASCVRIFGEHLRHYIADGFCLSSVDEAVVRDSILSCIRIEIDEDMWAIARDLSGAHCFGVELR